ncbi:MAG: aminotransferase class V-fold PLP-dependent enzyme [Actinomycetales bacterium]|uniref:Aminotransferase class V-fold PLP-dependent enzyme n=1 Tax=Candidatus Phosphoribacter hodrii TaxID=2953743 RepID=A0A935IQ97_9MICO|nr:aminotransferase class V-fold PLP-dependent enzyme [Candidatus Phosphoribacter hodrii]
MTSEWYEQAREEVARFIGAREDDLVVFTRTTTDSWNLLARTFRPTRPSSSPA